jgi:hypothetical protein
MWFLRAQVCANDEALMQVTTKTPAVTGTDRGNVTGRIVISLGVAEQGAA